MISETLSSRNLVPAAAKSPSEAASPASSFPQRLATAGRVTFALPFAIFGVFHFTAGEAMAAMVPVPGGVFWVYATGLALILGAIGILTQTFGRYAALGLAALMVTFILGVHVPGLSNPATLQLSLIGLLKDVALAGGALTWAALFVRRP